LIDQNIIHYPFKKRVTFDILARMELPNEHDEILKLLKENNRLVLENNELLKKLYRHNLIGFAASVAWYAILFGLPVALYYYVLDPYLSAFGSNYDLFRQGISEIPGFNAILHILP